MNIILIPKIGIIGGAISLTSGYTVMMICSYLKGQKVYKINYNIKNITKYFVTAIVIYFVNIIIHPTNEILLYLLKIFSITVFILFFIKTEQIKIFKKDEN
jgi:O-antigen/teichoic acid export membrane protein